MTQKSKTRENIGKLSIDLAAKKHDPVSAIDQSRECLKDYEKNVLECIAINLKKFFGDFYIVVLTKNERLMRNVIRNLFFARQSCPTPEYDQVVYKYNRLADDIKFMWVIPSKDACKHYVENRLEIVSDEQDLLNFVVQFENGSLLRLSKHLNMERPDSNILKTI